MLELKVLVKVLTKSYNMDYRFTLEKYDSSKRNKYTCPKCGKKNKFKRYIDTVTGEQLGDDIGICDRSESCKYHKPPSGIISIPKQLLRPKKIDRKPKKYFDKSKYRSMLINAQSNNKFAVFLWSHLGVKNGNTVIDHFKLGEHEGYTLYPYFDQFNNLVTYKKIQYLRNGKRDKNTTAHYDSNPNKYPIPLFGLHQIHKCNNRFAGIVEGEKSATAMRYYMPQVTWYASGGSNMLNVEKIKPLLGKEIFLFPDVGMFGKWAEIMDRAKSKYRNIKINISSECEGWHEQGIINEGDDIADYYIKNYKYNHAKQKIEKQII